MNTNKRALLRLKAWLNPPAPKKEMILWGVLLFSGAALLFSLAFGAHFARPIGDDYLLIGSVRDHGAKGYVEDALTLSNGRFSNAVFIASYFRVFGGNLGIFLSPLLIISGIWLGLFIVVKVWLRERFLANLVYATIMTVVLLFGAPSMFDTVYWFSGASVYNTSLILALFLLALVIFAVRKKHNRPPLLIATFLFALLVSGFSETAAVAYLIFCGSIVILEYSQLCFNTRSIVNPISLLGIIKSRLALTVISGLIVGLLIVILMPSSQGRLNIQTGSGSLNGTAHIVDSARSTLTQYNNLAKSYLQNTGVIFLLFAVSIVASRRIVKDQSKVPLAIIGFVLVLIMPLAALFLGFYAGATEGVNILPFRLTFLATSFISAGLFLIVGLIAGTYFKLIRIVYSKSFFLPLAVLGVLFFAHSLLGNSMKLQNALFMRSAAFDQRQQYIYAQQAAGQQTISVESVPILYRSHAVDASVSPTNWVIPSFEDYYYLNPAHVKFMQLDSTMIRYCANQSVGWLGEKDCYQLTQERLTRDVQ